jgi:succinate dehydrogenase / fumarate reductase cytochrome b subunit
MNHHARPKFITLWQIKFPVAAVVSIGHRASGVFMVLLIPLLIIALDMSTTPEGYAQLANLFTLLWVQILLLLAAWAFAHHFLAGIRFLLIDFDIGVYKPTARFTAWLVHGGAALIALLTALRLWL